MSESRDRINELEVILDEIPPELDAAVLARLKKEVASLGKTKIPQPLKEHRLKELVQRTVKEKLFGYREYDESLKTTNLANKSCWLKLDIGDRQLIIEIRYKYNIKSETYFEGVYFHEQH